MGVIMFINTSLQGLNADPIQGPVQPGASPLNPPSVWSNIFSTVSSVAKSELERVKKRGISIRKTRYEVPGSAQARYTTDMQPTSGTSSMPWIIGGIGLIGIAAVVMLMKKK